MLGMNESDTSLFWILALLFGFWGLKYLLDTVENIRIAKYKADRAVQEAQYRREKMVDELGGDPEDTAAPKGSS